MMLTLYNDSGRLCKCVWGSTAYTHSTRVLWRPMWCRLAGGGADELDVIKSVSAKRRVGGWIERTALIRYI